MSSLRVTTFDEQIYWQDLLDACTEYAENALDSSLLTRTITATYFEYHTTPLGFFGYDGYYPRLLLLPRGPVQSITSITDANGNVINFNWETYGNSDKLRMLSGYVAPLTVVYQAGYGDTADNVPSDIRMAIRTHVATLFEQRGSTDEKAILAVPHSLEAFYQLRRRSCYVA